MTLPRAFEWPMTEERKRVATLWRRTDLISRALGFDKRRIFPVAAPHLFFSVRTSGSPPYMQEALSTSHLLPKRFRPEREEFLPEPPYRRDQMQVSVTSRSSYASSEAAAAFAIGKTGLVQISSESSFGEWLANVIMRALVFESNLVASHSICCKGATVLLLGKWIGPAACDCCLAMGFA